MSSVEALLGIANSEDRSSPSPDNEERRSHGDKSQGDKYNHSTFNNEGRPRPQTAYSGTSGSKRSKRGKRGFSKSRSSPKESSAMVKTIRAREGRLSGYIRPQSAKEMYKEREGRVTHAGPTLGE